MSKRNLWTWVILVIFISINYFLLQGLSQVSFLLTLMGFTVVKVFLVVQNFMEMRNAHPAWLVIVGFVLLVYAGFIVVLNL